tara:strand:- start:2660 stop:3154 length:495 start_codon:yes stop_codon:yes gene_type:complete
MQHVDDWFQVKPSSIHGKGLFAKKHIPKNTLFLLKTSRPTTIDSSHSPNTYLLQYFINTENIDSSCIIDNKLVSLESIWHELHEDVFKYKNVRCKENFMFANDLGWPAENLCYYDSNCRKNNIEFLLVLSNTVPRRIIGVSANVIKDILPHQEAGIVYGFDFWK